MDLFDNNKDYFAPFELPNEDGYSMIWNENLNGYDIKIPNGVMFYSEHFFDKKVSDKSVEYFLENTKVKMKNLKFQEIGKPLEKR